jgi:putative ABC transport system permease protein
MIFRYSVRSIFAQKSSSLITLGVLASMTAVVMVLWGLTDGLEASVRGGGDPSLVIVLNLDSDEQQSSIPLDTLNRVTVFDGIARGSAGPIVSPEVAYRMPFVENGRMNEVRLRGVDPIALEAHRNVRIRGRLPNHLEPAVALGSRLIGSHQGFVENGTIHIGRFTWTVVGIVEAPGSTLESEIWLDRSALKQITKQPADNIAFVRLSTPEALGPFAKSVGDLRDAQLEADSENAYARKQIEPVLIYFDAIHLVLGILVCAMIFITANTIYTSFLGRTRELATLIAIGYTRRRVMLIMTTESLLLTGMGAALGMLLALAAHGQEFSIEAMSVFYAIQITPRVLLLGLGIAAITGCVASIVANIQIARINVLAGLRD